MKNSTKTGIGQPVRRREDFRLLTGKGCYSDDFNFPGQAYAVMVRSPHAHARIESIDPAKAKAAPGVVDVLTAAELEADGIGTIPGNAHIAGLVDVPLNNRDGSDRRVTPILDAAMLEHNPLNYHPLANDRTTAVAPGDLLRFIDTCGHVPRIIDLAAIEREPATALD